MGPVDPRLLQANERTLLAWIRTDIALITFGFVIARIGVWLRALASPAQTSVPPRAGTVWIGAAFILLGSLGNAMAIRRYAVARRAILQGEEIQAERFPLVFAVLVTALGGVVGLYLLHRYL